MMDTAGDTNVMGLLQTYQLSMTILIIRRLAAESLRSLSRTLSKIADSLDVIEDKEHKTRISLPDPMTLPRG